MQINRFELIPRLQERDECASILDESEPYLSFRLMFDFLPRKFAACSKPPSRDNHRKASYPRTHQRDQGAG